jgi:ABC-type transport system involved in cytochrome bd biosynthesis fused ATPase/permease subunit
MRDNSDLMILDEPSAGLDAEAEREVQTQLRRHRAGRTSLLISHRPPRSATPTRSPSSMVAPWSNRGDTPS